MTSRIDNSIISKQLKTVQTKWTYKIQRFVHAVGIFFLDKLRFWTENCVFALFNII